MKSHPKVIFVNGCFDVLHPGHISLFQYAKSLGDYLIVAIDSDRKVEEMKGKGRPIFSEKDRSFVLSSIRHIDEVRIFDTKSQLEDLVNSIKPDIMIVGSDWKGKEVVGSQYAKEVRFYDRVGEYSTTRTLQGASYR